MTCVFSAATPDAENTLKKSVGEVIAIAKDSKSPSALRESLSPVLMKSISFDTMTRRAIGPGWRQFTESQQKEATRLFTTLIIRTYSSKFTPGELPEISYKTPQYPAPGRVEIATKTLYKGSRYEVIYRLEETGGWRITDVVIEGASLVANYRTQFDAEFKEGGVDAVLNALKKSVSQPTD
jgi:phospholipid transport system substrate-binding protein